MSKPTIGLIPGLTPEDHEFSAMPAYRFEFMKQQYYEVVEHNGGIPIFIPLTEHLENLSDYLSIVDGLMLVGGEDINPEVYGEPLDSFCKPLMPRRDYFEMEAIRKAMTLQMPILGVCRGLQILNAACGGTLYQDLSYLPGAVDHGQVGIFDFSTRHLVDLIPGTQLQQLVGATSIETNTAHHQAINRLGQGLSVSARSKDGVIEAVEGKGFIIAVQWHPESWPLDPISRKLFQAFCQASGGFKAYRRDR